MASTRTYTSGFSGGELTSEFFGRIDDVKYPYGLALCRNYVVLPHGPVENRAGFRFVRRAKFADKRCRLVPFTYNDEQTMVLEMGEGYVRFHTQAATLLDGAAPYEISTPYVEADLPKLRYTQSADVLTFTTRGHPPAEVRRLGAINWEYAPIVFGALIPAPSGLTATEIPQGPQPTEPFPDDYRYVVTAVDANGVETGPSAEAFISADVFTTENYIALSWSPLPGATLFKLYKSTQGVFGYIGETTALGFNDKRIVPDTSRTPPSPNPQFDAPGRYPQAVGYHQQRRWFASTDEKPQNVWATRSGTESDLSFSIPSQASDAIEFRVAAREAASVQHIIPLQDLILLTRSGEWRVQGANSDVLTPDSVSIKTQSYVGANDAQPVVVNNVALFAAARGGHVRQLGYNEQQNGFVTLDLSLRAPHLFDRMEIVDMAFAKSPVPIVWMVSSSGKLLGLTYIPEEQLWAWHQHDTQGVFESICVVAEGSYDALYAVIRRGNDRNIERLEDREFVSREAGFFVDAGITYSGPPATVIGGLAHLEGQVVSILADGAVMPQQTVNGAGQITLPVPASLVHVGLPYVSDLLTLPVAVETAGFGQGRLKNVNRVWAKVFNTGGLKAGPSFDQLTEFRHRSDEPYGSPPGLLTGELELNLSGAWSDGGQVAIRQDQPLPSTILSISKEVTFGG